MKKRVRSVDWRTIVLFALGFVPFGLLVRTMERETTYTILLFVGLLFVYGSWSYYVTKCDSTSEDLFSIQTLVVVLVGLIVGVLLLGWVRPSVVTLVHLVAVALVFVYYWLITLAALVHDQFQRSTSDPSPPYPSVSVLVPAYNEVGYVGRTIQALLDADYPEEKFEVVVVDDGSTDGTYREATQFESDAVEVVQKENGGKYSALNYGLLFAGADVILTVDADSIVDEEALKRIVTPLEDPGVGAVASTVTIWNRDSLMTRCQQLEYTIGGTIYRRMLDLFGTVLIVPGCLGAFRREAIEEVFAYDPDTLSEDFDLTMQVHREGYDVTVGDARVYTEAPSTWADLYHQRLRWYRGNYMTIIKHWSVIRDPSYGHLNRIAFPLRLIELFFLPFASWIILAVIAWLFLTEFSLQLIALFGFFTSIVVLIAALAVHIEGEDWRLIVYSPLFVIGYKTFHDAVALKSLFDVVFARNLEWTRSDRVEQGQRKHGQSTEESIEEPAD